MVTAIVEIRTKITQQTHFTKKKLQKENLKNKTVNFSESDNKEIFYKFSNVTNKYFI
jgi:hypothetical protein